jgi:hypothetical protein
VRVLLGGSGGGGTTDGSGYAGGGCGQVIETILWLPAGSYPVVIGTGVAAVGSGPGNDGNPSTFHTLTALGGGGAARTSLGGRQAGPGRGGSYQYSGGGMLGDGSLSYNVSDRGLTSDITGTPRPYGNGGPHSGGAVVGLCSGGNALTTSPGGVLIVAYEI